jgi:predicted RNase H-like HicB family nuclease
VTNGTGLFRQELTDSSIQTDATENRKGVYLENEQDVLYIDVEYKKHERHYARFIAVNHELGLITEGSTFEKLLENLQDAIHLSLQSQTASGNSLPSQRRILIRMEFAYETPAGIEGE